MKPQSAAMPRARRRRIANPRPDPVSWWTIESIFGRAHVTTLAQFRQTLRAIVDNDDFWANMEAAHGHRKLSTSHNQWCARFTERAAANAKKVNP